MLPIRRERSRADADFLRDTDAPPAALYGLGASEEVKRLRAGAVYREKIAFRNTSAQRWVPVGNGLAYRWYNIHSRRVFPLTVSATFPLEVPMGHETGLEVEYRTPEEEGEYFLIWFVFIQDPLVRYHGILPPVAAWRSLIVPRVLDAAGSVAHGECCAVKQPSHDQEFLIYRRHPRNYTWAEFMRRVWEVDVLECDRCRGRLRIVAAIHSPKAIRGMLVSLGFPARASPSSCRKMP